MVARMQLPRILAILVTAATTSLARTPDGFQPASDVDLIVLYNTVPALNGAVMIRNGGCTYKKSSTTSHRPCHIEGEREREREREREKNKKTSAILTAPSATQTQPTIGTLTRLNGTSYAVIMIDLDIPTNPPNTLLHWMQTGLAPAQTPTTVNNASAAPGGGSVTLFLLTNSSGTAPLADYRGPNPPARNPLSHRYTQILVDTSESTARDVGALGTAAQTRLGFNASAVLAAANLLDRVVAGNSFNVTNPGPAMVVDTLDNIATAGTGGRPVAVAAGYGAAAVAMGAALLMM